MKKRHFALWVMVFLTSAAQAGEGKLEVTITNECDQSKTISTLLNFADKHEPFRSDTLKSSGSIKYEIPTPNKKFDLEVADTTYGRDMLKSCFFQVKPNENMTVNVTFKSLGKSRSCECINNAKGLNTSPEQAKEIIRH